MILPNTTFITFWLNFNINLHHFSWQFWRLGKECLSNSMQGFRNSTLKVVVKIKSCDFFSFFNWVIFKKNRHYDTQGTTKHIFWCKLQVNNLPDYPLTAGGEGGESY